MAEQSDQQRDSGMRSMTPPQHGDPPPSASTVWPTVFGVISIVFGAGASLAAICGGVFMAATAWIPQELQQYMGPPPQGAAGAIQVIGIVVTLPIAVVLLAAGIQLVRRRRSGIKLHRIWAVIKLLFIVASIITQFIFLEEMIEAQNRAMNQAQTPGFEIGVPLYLVFITLGALWGLWYPILVLVWFKRKRIEKETAAWS